jgi:hypothetical protein
VNYIAVRKDNHQITIELDSTKFELFNVIKNENFKNISLTRNVSLVLNSKEAYLEKVVYDPNLNEFQEQKLYTFNQDDNLNLIMDEMFKKHPLKDGRDIIANSYETLMNYLKD